LFRIKFRSCFGTSMLLINEKLFLFMPLCSHETRSTVPTKWLLSLVTLDMQSPHVFWRLQTSKSKTLIMETNKHDILHVSISVVWFQKCVHIKSCLARGYIPKAWRLVKMTFVSAHMVNYTQAKAYCPTFLLSFMQKMMQKVVTRNTKDETSGHAPTSVTISSNHGSPQKL